VTDRVASIDARTVVLELPEPLQLGPMRVTAREYATLTLTTEAGLVGKAYCLTRNAPVSACVERLLAPVAVGADSSDIDGLRERCIRMNVMVARTGLVLRAVGLLDVALWDVAAQRAGVPLHGLLGREAAPVPVAMVAAYPVASRSPEELAADVLEYAAAGFRLLKIARTVDLAFMRRWLGCLLPELPASSRLVVDAGYGWANADEALGELSSWGPADLAWLEDPLVPEDTSGIARLRRDGPHPIGIGDELGEKATHEALLAAEAVDVLRLDVLALGGVTGALEVLELASKAGVPVAFHVYPELSIHLATGVAGAVVETFDPDVPGGNPLDPVHRLVSGRLAIAAGLAAPPAVPGIGFELRVPQAAHAWVSADET
jgi:L-alanine-DL-glutamate epimerase-like enolase superfamily enzyme